MQELTQLTAENEDLWAGTLAGTGDLTINRSYYLYNCTNSEAVVFLGAAPEYQEVGPFVYKELNKYEDIKYDQEIIDPSSKA